MSLKNLTQGGQVTLHNVHMFRQVFMVTILITMISGLVFWGAKTWVEYTPDQRYALMSYYWADLKLAVSGNKEQETQSYRYPNGQEQEVRCIDIKSNKTLQIWGSDFESRMGHNAGLSLWFMSSVFLSLCAFWVWRGRAKKARKILSGLEVVTPKVLKKLIKKDASKFHIGGIPLRKNTETQHLLVCGTTGAGKSTCFFELLPQIRAANQRAVIVDTTGEFVSRYYREGKDILINPFDNRTVGWTPWIDCVSPYHYDEIASAFIPQTGQDKFWSDAARTIFAEALKHHASQDDYDTAYMLHMLLSVPLRELFNHLKATPAASLVDPAGDRTAMSIRAHLSSYLKPLLFLPKDRPVFSIRQWVQAPGARDQEPGKQPESPMQGTGADKEQDNNSQQGENSRLSAASLSPPPSRGQACSWRLAPESQWVFITATPDQRETLRPFLTALTSSAVNALMSCVPNQDRRLWFIIDELASLHKQEAFPKALAEIRKYGGCIAVGLQDIPQLQAQYGRSEAESLVSLLNTRVIFRNGHPDTARVMSQMLGEQEVREAVEGISYGAHQMRDGVSLNEHTKIKPVITPTELMSLENREAYLKLPGNLPITKIKFEIPSAKLICPTFVPMGNDVPPKARVLEKANQSEGKQQVTDQESTRGRGTENSMKKDPKPMRNDRGIHKQSQETKND